MYNFGPFCGKYQIVLFETWMSSRHLHKSARNFKSNLQVHKKAVMIDTFSI